MNLKELYQIAKKELEQLYDGELMDFRLEQAAAAAVEYNESSNSLIKRNENFN